MDPREKEEDFVAFRRDLLLSCGATGTDGDPAELSTAARQTTPMRDAVLPLAFGERGSRKEARDLDVNTVYNGSQLDTKERTMQRISPFLWFDDRAEEAAIFYVSLFPNSEILSVSRIEDTPSGTAMSVRFVLDGLEFQALNGGPQFPFTEAISFFVRTETQEEIDDLWEKLTRDGGEPRQCGWLKDKYGLSWQIVPPALQEMLSDPDPVKAGRVMQAMLKMSKLDIAELREAHDAG